MDSVNEGRVSRWPKKELKGSTASSEEVSFRGELKFARRNNSNLITSPLALRNNNEEIKNSRKLIFSGSLSTKQQQITPRIKKKRQPSIVQFFFHKKENTDTNLTSVSPLSKPEPAKKTLRLSQQASQDQELVWSSKNKKRMRRPSDLKHTKRLSGLADEVIKVPQIGQELKRRATGARTWESSQKRSGSSSKAAECTRKPAKQFYFGTPKLEISDFVIGRKLGGGSFGEVYLAQHRKSGFLVAIKMMKKKDIIAENYVSQVIRQIEIQSYIDHPNIASLYTILNDETYIYLVLELCPGGNLLKQIRKDHHMAEEKVKTIMLEICEGMKTLHDQNILHRDLKPENVMMSFETPKITDFGWAVYRGSSGGLRDTQSGSPLYHSPELVQKMQYDEKADTWTIGILTYECLMGIAPFKVYSQLNMRRIVEDELTFPQYIQISDQAKSFMEAALRKNSSERMGVRDMLAHPFLRRENQ